MRQVGFITSCKFGRNDLLRDVFSVLAEIIEHNDSLVSQAYVWDQDHQLICTQCLTNTVQAGRTSWNQQYGSILYCAKTGGIPSDVFGSTDLLTLISCMNQASG